MRWLSRSEALSAADWLALRSGVARLLRPKYAGCGAVLMFHNIANSGNDALNHSNCFTEAGLFRLLKHCAQTGRQIVTVDEALQRLVQEDSRPFLVVTFDDGYRDNLTRALPLMEKFSAPFTVFVCSALIQRSLDYWWGGLIDLFKRHDDVEIEPMGMRFRLGSQGGRDRALNRVLAWIRADVEKRRREISTVFERYGVSTEALLDRHALNEADLKVLAEHRLVTIGGHGYSHRPLAAMSRDEVTFEIMENRRHLEVTTGQEIAHFAYPFGDSKSCSWREAELVRRAAYRTAFSTRVGNLFPEHAVCPFMLPRGAMNSRREASYNSEAQFAGVHRFIESRGGLPIDPETLPPNDGRWTSQFQ